MKKKILSFLTAVLMTVTFGCSDKDNETSKSSENNDILEPSASQNNYITESRYIKSNFNVYDTGCILGNDTKLYLDFETMEKTVLCAKPNCSHNTSECVAQVVGDTPIIYEDYIYYFDSESGVNETPDGLEFYIDTKFNRISLSTSEIEQVTEFTDCVPSEYDGCLICDDTLYFCGDNMNPRSDDYGNIIYADAGGTHYFCSIDLNTGEYVNYGSIYDEDKKYEGADSSSSAKVRGFYNSKIYIEYSFSKEKITDVSIFNDNDARDIYTILTFEFDPKTESLTESDLPSASFMDYDTYVYSNYPKNTSTVVYANNTYTIENLDVNLTGRVFNGKLFMYDCWYDLTDGLQHSLGEYREWEVISFYDNCYILVNGSRYAKLTEEELLSLE